MANKRNVLIHLIILNIRSNSPIPGYINSAIKRWIISPLLVTEHSRTLLRHESRQC